MESTIVKIRNLTVGYDGDPVLRDVSLDIKERDFIGVIEVNIDPNRMVFAKHSAQLRSNPLRKNNRCSGTQPDDFHMIDFAQFGEDVFQTIITHQQCVAT